MTRLLDRVAQHPRGSEFSVEKRCKWSPSRVKSFSWTSAGGWNSSQSAPQSLDPDWSSCLDFLEIGLIAKNDELNDLVAVG
jgi:hypothetical protein